MTAMPAFAALPVQVASLEGEQAGIGALAVPSQTQAAIQTLSFPSTLEKGGYETTR